MLRIASTPAESRILAIATDDDDDDDFFASPPSSASQRKRTLCHKPVRVASATGRRLGHERRLPPTEARRRPNGLKHGPMASSVAQWPQAWSNGLKRGPMASSVAHKRCTSSCGNGMNSSRGGTSQREELPAAAHSSVQSPSVCASASSKGKLGPK